MSFNLKCNAFEDFFETCSLRCRCFHNISYSAYVGQIKGIICTKMKIVSFTYSHVVSKPVWLTFFCGTQKKILKNVLCIFSPQYNGSPVLFWTPLSFMVKIRLKCHDVEEMLSCFTFLSELYFKFFINCSNFQKFPMKHHYHLVFSKRIPKRKSMSFLNLYNLLSSVDYKRRYIEKCIYELFPPPYN